MTPPLRVTSLFGSLLIGGDENRCLAFARHLPEGVAHRVLVASAPEDAARAAAFGGMRDRYAEHGVSVDSLGLPARSASASRIVRLLTAPGLLARAVLTLRRRLIADRVEVLDARLPTGMVLGALATAGLPIALVGTDYFPDWWEGPEGRWVRPLVFARLDALITDSAFMGAAFGAWLGDRVAVVHNGIPTPTSRLSRAEARSRLGLPARSDYPVISQVARIIPYKGQEDTVEVLLRLLPSRPELRAVICGFDGLAPGFADRLRARISAAGLGERVRVGGYAGPIADVWAATDVHLHPSHRDSSPIAIHEAMSLGIPSVSTRVSGIPELIEDGVSGHLTDDGDLDALTRATGALVDDATLRSRLGSAARARWNTRHRPEQMVAATISTMHDALSRRSSA